MKLTYPILTIEKNGLHSLMPHFREKSFKRTTVEIIDSDWFKSIIILDCNNRVFEVEEVLIIGNAGWIGRWHPFVNGRLVNIEVVLRESKIELQELKKEVNKNLKFNKENFESIVGVDVEKIMAKVEGSNSVKAVIDCFLN